MPLRLTIACILALLGLSACSRDAQLPPAGQTPQAHGPAPAADTAIPDTPLSALGAPAAILRNASATATLRGARGADFDAALPHSRCSPDGRFGLFTPDPSQPGTDGHAYAIYRMSLTGFAVMPLIQWETDTGAPLTDCWIGLADFEHGYWRWFSSDDPALSSQYPLSSYTSTSGELVVIVAIGGSQPQRLKYIRLGGNLPPVAALTVTPDSGAVPTDVTFDATASYDIDGDITGYTYQSNTQSYGSGTDPTLVASVTNSATNEFTLTVEDDLAATTQCTTGGTYYSPPVADLIAEPDSGMAELPVLLRDYGSHAGDFPIVLYEFDAEGDGAFEQSGAQDYCSHIYATPGSYNATLRVTDSAGHSASVSVPITVDSDDGLARWRRFRPIGTHGGRGETMESIAGTPAVVSYDEIADTLLYVRASDAQGKHWSPMATVGATGYWPGSPEHRAGLADIGGLPAVAYINAEDGHAHLLYTRAADADGASWGAPVELAYWDDTSDIYCNLLEVNGHPALAYGHFNEGLQYRRALDAAGTNWDTAHSLGGFSIQGISLSIVDGRPAIAFDAPGLRYVRADDADGDNWPASTLLTNSGDYPSMAVINGNPAIAYYTVGPYDPPEEDKDLMYIRASDTDGTAWGLPVTLDDVHFDAGRNASLKVVNGKPAVGYFCLSRTGWPDLMAAYYIAANDADGTSWGAYQMLQPYWFALGDTSLIEIPAANPAVAVSDGGVTYWAYY